ncbi:hypothetical protein H5324_001626 [Salmonella enterica]|nr:hypothetical protein [Salmonella enterica]
MTERYDFQNCFPREHKSARLARQLYAALNLIGEKEKTFNSHRNTLIYFCCYIGNTGTALRNFRLATEDIIEGYIRYREKYFVVAIMKLCRELGLRTDEAILGMAS